MNKVNLERAIKDLQQLAPERIRGAVLDAVPYRDFYTDGTTGQGFAVYFVPEELVPYLDKMIDLVAGHEGKVCDKKVYPPPEAN